MLLAFLDVDIYSKK